MDGYGAIDELERLREAAVVVRRNGGAGGGRFNNNSTGIIIVRGRLDDTVLPFLPATFHRHLVHLWRCL
jgi:hypothetical protein